MVKVTPFRGREIARAASRRSQSMTSNPKPAGRRRAGHRATEAPSSVVSLVRRSPSATDDRRTAGPAWDERQFGSLVANVPGAVYRCASGARDMVFMSAEIENICGYPAADFLGHPPARTHASVIHSEDRDLVASTVDEAVGRREPFMIDYRIVHANGELRRAWERGRGVFGADGRLLFVDGVIFDHTEQKRADQQHRLLFEHNPQPILAYERATLWIIAVSDAAVASYGYSREEFLSMTVRDLTPHEDVEQLVRYVENAISTRTARSSTWRSRATI
jgi:PAS domain-containing protein